MKILVTGATGFLGIHLVTLLLEKGIEVIASGRSVDKARTLSWFNKVNFIPLDFADFTNEEIAYEYFDRPDVLIHLAWEGLPNYDDLIHLEKNLMYQYLFLKNYINSGGKHILVTGTCLEYGIQNGCLSEDMPTNPISSYAISKDTLRRFLEVLQNQQNSFIFQWVRLFYMYGNGQNDKSLIPQLESAINNGESVFNMSGGEQIRDYLPVEKVAEFLIEIALQNNVNGIINCCSGFPISVKKLVEEHLQFLSSSIRLNLGYYPYNGYEPMYFWGNNKKLLNILNK